jgi:DNA-binding IclR family transcriptional regulator
MYAFSSLVTLPQPRGTRKTRLLAYLRHAGPSHVSTLADALQWPPVNVSAYCASLARQQVLRRIAPATYALAGEE